MTDKIEAELFAYAELIDLNPAQKMSDQLQQIAGYPTPSYTGGRAGQSVSWFGERYHHNGESF